MVDTSNYCIKMWGWAVDTGASAFEFCTSGCQMGIAGDGNGQFNSPAHLAVDAADNIYVADANGRLKRPPGD